MRPDIFPLDSSPSEFKQAEEWLIQQYIFYLIQPQLSFSPYYHVTQGQSHTGSWLLITFDVQQHKRAN